MKKTQNYIAIFFLFCLFPLIYSQESTISYFDIVKEKQLEFDLNSKHLKDYETTLALHKASKKFARWQWFWKNRIDKKGNLNAYNKELFSSSNIKQLRARTIVKPTNADWKIIGPEKYPEGTNPSGIKGIGRIDAIVVNPKNQNHVIIGARAGGIWETYHINDSIPTWNCLTNNLPVFTVNDLKIVNNTLYASTSNKNTILAQGERRYGLGVIKKELTDSFWQLPHQTFESKKIAVSKNNSNVLYAIGEKYIYKSIDAGDHWSQLTSPVKNLKNSKLFLTNIEINPNNDDIIIITGKLYVYDITNNKEDDILIFKSENGGESWKNLTADLENFINKKIKNITAKDKPISLTEGLKNHVTTAIYKQKLFLCIHQMYRPNHVYFVTLEDSWKNFNQFNTLSKSNIYYYATDDMDATFQVISDDEILIGNRRLRLINNQNHTVKALDNNYKYLHQDIRAINFDASLNRLLIGTDGGINKNIDSKKREKVLKIPKYFWEFKLVFSL